MNFSGTSSSLATITQLALLFCVGCALIAAFAKYYFMGNYPVIVRASCDPDIRVCFQECDDCDSDEQSFFTAYEVPAYAFQCTGDSCNHYCPDSFACVEISCQSQDTYTCTTYGN